MSKWGVFVTDESLHVAPAESDGTIIHPHQTSEECPCNPIKDSDGIWVHQDKERGGCNA